MSNKICPCQSKLEYEKCCGPFIEGTQSPESVEALMRSRYSAYVKGKVQYIVDTTHPKYREESDEEAIKSWSEQATWLGLKIVHSSQENDEGIVEFIATYSEKGITKEHHEIANFKKEEGKWLFNSGKIIKTKIEKVGRNDPCTCGSGKKYKKCCA